MVIKDCALQSARDGVLDSRNRGILLKNCEAFSIDGARIAERAPSAFAIQFLQGLSEHSVGWLAEIQTDVGFAGAVEISESDVYGHVDSLNQSGSTQQLTTNTSEV